MLGQRKHLAAVAAPKFPRPFLVRALEGHRTGISEEAVAILRGQSSPFDSDLLPPLEGKIEVVSGPKTCARAEEVEYQ